MSDAKTRIIHLQGGQQRGEAPNTGTLVVVFDQSLEPESFRDLFIRNYKVIHHTCTRFSQPGVAIFAIDSFTGKLVGSLCVAAKVGAANSAIIGRHGMTDLYLDGDSGLSLRHLALVLWPLVPSEDVRFRIVDLRTRSAFQDENGRRYESLVAEGPLFIRCGSYVLFFLVTGDQIGWPDSAKDGWACIPERVYVDSGEAEPDRWQRKRELRQIMRAESSDGRNAITLVHSSPGPIRAQAQLLIPGEETLGTLRITSRAGIQKLVVGQSAARSGILLGRYSRCDIDGSHILVDESISRVHLLILGVADQLYAIDTASTHGTWIRSDQREIRISPLVAGQEFCLGDDLVQLRWSPA